MASEPEADNFAYRVESGEVPLQFMGTKEPSGDQALHTWMGHVDHYLQALIALEGREFLCSTCIVNSHGETPLHRIKFWNGTFLEKTSLKALGLRIQLGHSAGDPCPYPAAAPGDGFVIIDIDAIHSVNLDFCDCGKTADLNYVQLLQHQLYPATSDRPKSAATFRLLKFFEILQYESKLSAYEFHQAIARLTDNTSLEETKNRYNALLHMTHEWRHLKLLKRSGLGHDPDRSAQDAREGECAVLCPACPHPDINMAPDWEKEPEETSYIHALNIAVDANFRLKRKDISSDQADPGLSQGFSYFVEHNDFKQYLHDHMDEVEPKSTCSRHDAVNLADTRPGQGFASTGVATVECARHNMKRASAVGDLQRGERYCNIDYLVNQSLRLSRLKSFIFSYDIACQYSINAMKRLEDMNPDLCIVQPDAKVRFVVPKFHLPAHIPACQTRYAFMLTPGAGLGDGDSLLRKLTAAATDLPEQAISHRELKDVLDKSMLALWKTEVEVWERDPSMPNPFDIKVDKPTQAAVRRQLAEEERKMLDSGQDFSLDDKTSQSGLISMGLDIEANQRSLKASAGSLWEHSGDRQIGRITLQSNALIRRIEDYYGKLQLYIPASVALRKKFGSTETLPTYKIPLWLPSQVGNQAPVDLALARLEFKLREAQAHEALGVLRCCLQMRATFYDTKDRWSRGQKQNTRSRNSINSAQTRINAARDEYRAARTALISLSQLLSQPMDKSLKVLNDSDIRSMKSTETDRDSAVIDGMKAYARRQADMCHQLKVAFEVQWVDVPKLISNSKKLASNPDMWYELKEKEEKEAEAAKLKCLASRALGKK
ncbi:hypothetical protein EST38_g14149 [Candolleomyces aberdarensis]|uniref:CxC2-like cysteine cluster KDZ transposase-associated domain-containing protein n=1 Tax=Candolleomyces aberdarensis TaxID=2316362 RepID=A0A4Q2CZV6_9AGAR|nr:hypothetical protein EST38_g14149 [Candolleomyces aberdarensis]